MLFLFLKEEGGKMHIDENKKFDKRNVERNIKNGIITQKDYEIYLSRLSDVSDEVFNPEESIAASRNLESKRLDEIQPRKKVEKKKTKGKGKY
jgi:hypothetical protein